jgi:ribonuclease P/MRP protein subunit POP3
VLSLRVLLCSLLSPVGQHRANHLTKSKGKRSKKRKRHEAKKHTGEENPSQPPIPPTPEISSFLAIGLNSITRALQESSQKPKPPSLPKDASSSSHDAPDASEITEQPPAKPTTPNPSSSASPTPSFSAIFVLRSIQPAILHAHLPQLIATASLARPSSPATRLVQLPRGSDERVCQALGLPRASFIGLVEGAPHAGSLVELIRRRVPEIEVPWLKEATDLTYLPVKINAIETFAPVLRKQPA